MVRCVLSIVLIGLLVACGGGTGSGSPPPNAASPVAPVISSQPASVMVNAGQTATFSVVASAATTYAWKRNGVSINGATSGSYTTPPATAEMNGSQYTVTVSGPGGSVESGAATLSVQWMSFTVQPKNVTAAPGATVQISAEVSANPEQVSWQWQRRNAGASEFSDIVGATSGVLELVAVSTGDSGAEVRVRVTHVTGTFLSNAAKLTVQAAGASAPVRAWYAKGQTWIVFKTTAPFPIYYSVYRGSSAFSSTAQATRIGQTFEREWGAARLKLADPNATWRVPTPDGGTYTLAADEGLFVYTPRSNAAEYFAVVPQTGTTVAPEQRTQAAVTQSYDPLNDPVQCHVQLEGVQQTDDGKKYPYTVYSMWVEGRDDWNDGRPDLPVLANAAKNGAPHMFAIYEPSGPLPSTPFPATVLLHGGGQFGTYWNWRPWFTRYNNIGIVPVSGVTIAQDDRVYRSAGTVVGEESPSYWLGWYAKMPAVDPPLTPTPGDVVVPYTLRRVLWIQDWILTRSKYAGRIDSNRVSVLGTSMGGLGTHMIARFRPERFASASSFVPVIEQPDNGAANKWLGAPDLNLVTSEIGRDGSVLRVRDFFDPTRNIAPVARDRAFTRMYRGRNEVDLELSKYGWEDQNVPGVFRALDAARLGVQLYWDNRDHTPSAWTTDDPKIPERDIGEWVSPVRTDRGSVEYQTRYRANQSYPGFYGDDQDPGVAGRQPDVGSGSRTSGDPWGTWGGYFEWDTATLTDTPVEWSVTLYLSGQSPASVDNFPRTTATTSLTLRKQEAFKPAPGSTVDWELRDGAGGALLQSGSVQVEADGLVDIRGLTVRRDPQRSRLIVKLR